MPIIEGPIPTLSAEEFANWPGLRGAGGAGGRFRSLLPELLAEVEASHLLAPCLAYETFAISTIGTDWIHLRGGAEITHIPVTACRLEQASELVAAVVTIGDRLEARVSEWFARGEAARALVLGEIGTAALFAFTKVVVAEMSQSANGRGLRSGSPLQPGNDGLDISHQRLVSNLAGSERIGVRVIGKGMMDPVNSLSMIVGLGKTLAPHKKRDCDACKARDRCHYRDYDELEHAT